jgi:hypothetical protein
MNRGRAADDGSRSRLNFLAAREAGFRALGYEFRFRDTEEKEYDRPGTNSVDSAFAETSSCPCGTPTQHALGA